MRYKGLIAIIVVVVFVSLLGLLFSGMSQVGDNQGYEPDQPIAFSHKIHVGENQIQCLYCHYGAERSRYAGIPADSVCMNCHSNIKKDSPEVTKVIKALEKDKPIEWIKVNRLADFVYFSHERHVGIGKIKCQICHGPVETMTRIRQDKSLNMGWCINCHRTSDIVVHGTMTTTKVSDVGGLDCAKCHY